MEYKLPSEMIERSVLVRKAAETAPEFGKKPEERTIEESIKYGVVNVNKPSGPTSHQISDYVKKILHVAKAGHSGTLDPKVTGVLPIALARATKVVQTLLPAGKEYVCIMHIHKELPEKKVREVINEFIGEIEQMPPVKSAVKRQKRKRNIYYLNVLEIDGQDVLFRVGCQAGTYIRKLAHDIGEKLGSGAHMAELVRTKAGPFNDKSMVSLQDIKDAYEMWKENNEENGLKEIIIPMEKAVEHLPKVWVIDSAVDTLAHGADLSVPGIAKLHSNIDHDDMVAVMTIKDELIALGKALMNSQNMYMQKKGIAIKTTKIFYERGIYPKFVRKTNQNILK